MHELVVSEAKAAHAAHWRMSGDEGTGDKLAKLITDTWQKALRARDPSRFAVEHRVAPHLKERIDVVDLAAGIRNTQRIETVIFNGNAYDRPALDQISAHVQRRAKSWSVACKILWRFIKNPVSY